MPRRIAIMFALLWLTAFCHAQESWMGIYIQGQKIGYSRTETFLKASGGTNVVSQTIIKSAMLGADMEMDINSTSSFDIKGQLQTNDFMMKSGGRTMRVFAEFSEKSITATQTSGGPASTQVIPIPKGVVVVDDPTSFVVGENALKPGESRKFYVFDAPSLSLVEMSATVEGTKEVDVRGKPQSLKVIKIDDPRAPMTIYLNANDEVVKILGPVGMEMYPESKKDAQDMSLSLGESTGGTDLADASSIQPDKPITAANSRTSLTIRMTGIDLSKTPVGEHQTVKKDGDGWLVTIHPIDPRDAKPTIKAGEVPAAFKSWIEPDVRIPSDSLVFKTKAAEIVGSEKDIIKSAEKIRQFVLGTVRVNAGIGVLRDATEVLETKEGVCRDHAVLMATLCRAAGIPTRLVNGMVYDQGRFWYHAWVEVYDGQKWYGMDSTRPSPRLTAGHLKTSQGTAAQALTSFLLDGAKIEVVEGARGASGK